MAFHDYQSSYDHIEPYTYKEVKVAFIDVDQMHTELQTMFNEICSDKPDLNRLYDSMQYVAQKYCLDFDEEFLQNKEE